MRFAQNILKYTRSLRRSDAALIILMCISFGLIVVSGYNYRHNIDVDALAYIPIAEHYARGDFSTAVNAYWSPAVSMLMAPLVLMGVDGRYGFMAVNIFAATVILLGGSMLVRKYSGKSFAATLFYIITSSIFLLASIRFQNPDLLLSAWFVCFIGVILYADSIFDRNRNQANLKLAILLALVGVVGYMIKLYALPLFIVTVLLWLLGRYICDLRSSSREASNKKKVMRRHAIILAGVALAYAILLVPWVTTLSVKYGHFTVGSSASVNVASKFTSPNVKSTGVSELVQEPPYDKATTVIEDPSLMRTNINVGTQESIGFIEKLQNLFAGRVVGIPAYVEKLNSMWLFFFPVMGLSIAVLCYLSTRSRHTSQQRFMGITIISMLVYLVGYAMLSSSSGGNVRYYWPMMISALMLTGVTGSALVDSNAFKHGKSIGYVTLVAAGILLLYQYSIPARSSLTHVSRPPAIEVAAQNFFAYEHPRLYDNYTSNNIRRSNEFAYFVDGQSYRAPNLDVRSSQDRQLMLERNIRYYLLFSGEDIAEADLLEAGVLKGEYFLGNNYQCENGRSPKRSSCTLYIIKLTNG